MRRRVLAAFVLAGATSAAAQVSRDVTLLAHQDLYATYASCWGYTSPGGKEFALLGTHTGTSIVDVTTATAPIEIAFIAGTSSSWREMKTYDRYAYIVTEGAGGGMQIVDLEATPPVLVRTYTTTFTTAHTLTIAGRYAYASGARMNGAQVGIRILDLADPTHPVDVGGWNQFYAHDCTVRGDRLYAACINNALVAIVDIGNKAAPSTLTTFTWPGNKAHNCDLTTDGKYLYTTDETAGGRIHVFDVQNLGDIRHVAEWTPNPAGIVHNVHIRGDRAYVAYYTEGVRILDISDAEFPVEVGYFDTWPGASGGFNGCWEVYPYAPSGTLLASDISTGLYVLRFDPTQGGVRGTVREQGTGAPLQGASVAMVAGASVATSATGYYKLIGAAGTRTLVTAMFGFRADTTDVVVLAGSNTQQDVALERVPSAPLRGRVRDAASAAPVAGVGLALQGTPLRQASQGSGAYAFGAVPYGVYVLGASRFGYASQARTVSVTLRQDLDTLAVDFDLLPAAIAHDFEAGASGWTRVAPPNEATAGLWVWADPVGSGGGSVQPEDDHTPDPGVRCWVTGNASSAADGIGTADVDGGATVLLTPRLDLSGMSDPVVSYWRWYSNDAGSNPGTDTLHVAISSDDGLTWRIVEKLHQSQAAWTQVDVAVAGLVPLTNQVRLRFLAEDLGGGSIVEAAVDDFMVFDQATTSALPAGVGDRLHPGAPNPFHPATRIRFDLARGGVATLRVHDVRGRVLRTLAAGRLAPGSHRTSWDGRDEQGGAVASGVYWVRLETETTISAQRMVLAK